MDNLNKLEVEDIITRLQNGENLPQDYKYKLFPTAQKEYELVYGGKMRKEDVLANEDGITPVPLQVEKIYNDNSEEWSNILVFGENLQFLKTIYQNQDLLIKDKVKEKVSLIYIDPPFATTNEFTDRKGQRAYSDKVKGAEFVEFLRRRLIVAKEILSPTGSIYVHLDWKKAHYIKLVMDEIFGENYFQNEIAWCYGEAINSKKRWNRKHDVLYFYSNSDDFTFNPEEVLNPYAENTINKYKYTDENGEKYRLMGRGLEGSPIRSKRDVSPKWEKTNPELVFKHYMKDGVLPVDYWNIPIINQSSNERTGYPTQKPEQLLEKIIKASTNEGDLILDFFAGSGTSIIAAEKLNRRWIACDIGKLAFYTIQKRLIDINNSKDLINSKKKYGKEAKKFVTANTGYYDLEKIFNLEETQYKNFVLDLFEVKKLENKKINGIKIDGEKSDGYYCTIFPYWKFKEAAVDEEYLEDLHQNIGKKIGKRIYIIAPVNYINFFSDYYEIEGIRYYFLKVPYQIIKELHKVDFKPIRQPQSVRNVNSLEEAVGFHFMRTPKVESDISMDSDEISIKLKKFYSEYESEDNEEIKNFESLSLVLIDKDFDNKAFNLSKYYFAEDIIDKKKKKNKDEELEFIDESIIKEKLKTIDELLICNLKKIDCGKKIMIIYIDTYGNEFRELVEVI